MKTLKTLLIISAASLALASCDRKDEDLIEPRDPNDFPIVIFLSDEEGGDLEDSDEVGIALEILPVWDEATRDLEGKIPTPTTDMRISFEVFDPSGFSAFADYILGGDAIYEIDDCTDSSDEGIDLNFVFDASAGTGSFDWPTGVEELEVILELNEATFDDDAVNPEERGFSFRITDIEGAGAGNDIRINRDIEFTYFALDDEVLFGEWVLDHTDPEQFTTFTALFETVNEDLPGLAPSDIDAIEFEFDIEAMVVKVVLTETSEDECEPGEFENEELEIEAEYDFGFDELFGMLGGALSFEGEAEFNDVPEEFTFEGAYQIEADGSLTLTLSGETENGEIEEQTLILNR